MNTIDKTRAGEQFTALVRDISIEGYGVIDHPEGFVFFVLGVFPGDEGLFEIISIKRKYGYAKLINLTTSTEFRIDAKCNYQGFKDGQCGGCPWMMIPYEKQIEFKTKMIQHQLIRSQWFNESLKLNMISSPQIFGYRNRAQLKTNGKILGFVSRFSRKISPIQNCLVLNSKLQEKFQHLQSMLPQKEWEPSPNHPWCYIEIDDDQEIDEFTLNKRRPFKQANPLQNKNMQVWLKDKITSWDTNSVVIELFAGSGNFTKILSLMHFKQLIAVEIGDRAIQTLIDQQFTHCTPLAVNLYKPSEWKTIKEQTTFCDYLLVDPPRDGFNKLGMFVKQWHFPKKIIYISCHLETFINDVFPLKKMGYILKEVTAVDQFPHTPHIELMSVFERTSI